MQEFTANGLTMRWAEPAAAALSGLRRVHVHAAPASPANVVRVIHSLGDGPERAARCWPVGSDPDTDAQIFAADLPVPRGGETLHWRPVLSNGAREADPGRAAAIAPASPVPSSPIAGAPPPADAREEPPAVTGRPERFPYALDFMARVSVPLQNPPYAVGDTPDGLRVVYPVAPGGTIRGPRINGIFEPTGGDWMRIREDGIGIAGVSALVKTDDGALLLTEYSGVVDFGPDGQRRILEGNPPAQAEANLCPRFVASDPAWAWINRLQMIAFGRVTFATLLVEYDIYAMRSEAVGFGETPQ